MKAIKYLISYLVPVPLTVINYGSGSDFVRSYGSDSASQKVTVTRPDLTIILPE
jgi:hypothetical protein